MRECPGTTGRKHVRDKYENDNLLLHSNRFLRVSFWREAKRRTRRRRRRRRQRRAFAPGKAKISPIRQSELRPEFDRMHSNGKFPGSRLPLRHRRQPQCVFWTEQQQKSKLFAVVRTEINFQLSVFLLFAVAVVLCGAHLAELYWKYNNIARFGTHVKSTRQRMISPPVCHGRSYDSTGSCNRHYRKWQNTHAPFSVYKVQAGNTPAFHPLPF